MDEKMNRHNADMEKDGAAMLRRLGLMLLLAVVGTAAQASEALATKSACMGCHQPDKKVVGPSWKDVAAKYADGSKTAEQLASSIRQGSSGKWGAVPMPAQPALSDADALILSKWILGQR